MQKQIPKLKKLVSENLEMSKNEILIIFGEPSKKTDFGVWLYRKYYFGFFFYETVFIFQGNTVADISITKYFFGKEVKNLYYKKGVIPEYKTVRLKKT